MTFDQATGDARPASEHQKAVGASGAAAARRPPLLLLRPMEIGELLDEAFDVYRRNFGLLFGLIALLNVPYTLLQAALPSTPGTRIAIALVAIAIVIVTNGALTGAAMDRLLGRQTTMAAALRRALRQGWKLLAGQMVYILAVAGGMLVAALPGLLIMPFSPIIGSLVILLGVLLFLIPGGVLMLWSLLLVPVIVAEDRGVSALSRCRQLSQGQVWRLFLLSLALLAAILVYSVVLGGLVGLVFALTGTNPLEPPDRTNLMAVLIHAAVLLASTLIQSAWVPVLGVAQVLTYVDLRIRREAYDLELLTTAVEARVEAARAAIPSPGPVLG